MLTSSRQGVKKTQHNLKYPSMWLHQGGQWQIMSLMSWQNWSMPAGTRRRCSRDHPAAWGAPSTHPAGSSEPPAPLTVAEGDAEAHEEGDDDQPKAGAVRVNEGEPEDASL